MNKQGFTVWHTGLPFTGKKDLAKMVQERLESMGYRTELLIGGEIRREYEQDLGFTKDEVYQNVRRICYECQLLAENGIVAIAVTISPFKDLRDECRKKLGRYVEVYHKCPMEVLKLRDTKGLFEKAKAGIIKNVAGISYPYEEPDKPEVLIEIDKESLDQGLEKILTTLHMLHYVTETRASILTEREEAAIRKRLKDLGYL